MPLPSLKSLVSISQKPPLQSSELTWTGPSKRPDWCRQCPQDKVSFGWIPDEYPDNPKIAFLLEAGGKNEGLESRPLAGKSGYLFESKLLHPLGYKRSDVLIANVLRCTPKDNEYPTGKDRVAAERLCRHYDHISKRPGDGIISKGLADFRSNLFIITFHPAAILRTNTFLRLVQRDIEKAFGFYEKGYRPIVLMGDKAMHLVAPWTKGKGGVKFWRGHWWEEGYGGSREDTEQKSDSDDLRPPWE